MRENNAYANKTWKYTYDKAGNITGKYVYAYTTGTLPSTYQDHISYGYSAGAWGDMLTSYNGTTISYDAIGNPTNWRNGITNLTWNGRELNSFVKGSYTHSFEYNADGIRTQKTNWYTGTSMAEIYHYVLDGTKIVSEYRTYASDPTPGNVKYYYYDAAGSIAGFEYNGTTYYFQKNLQGDIIRICNITGNTVVEYTYDAWGKVLSITGSLANTVGQANPFRYRGYYYDSETGLYYLQTRYYDPEIGRFLNADGYIGANGDIPGYNMFAYCSNNPVMSCDPSGEGWLSDAWNSICDWVEDRVNDVVEAITVIVDGAINIIQNVKEDIEHFNWNNTDVDTVYNAHYFSAYKGQLVVRHSIPFLTSGAMAGTIFLNHSEDSHGFENRKDTLNHEWGHLQQEKELGILYIPMVAVPSVVNNIASRFDDDLANNYYNMPWERKADLFGGVNRGSHKPGSEIIANIYHNIGVTINRVFMTAISCMLGA